jgi:mannosyltransferase OCH1-like enzyme
VANLSLLHPDSEHPFFDNRALKRFIDDESLQHRPTFDAFPCPVRRFDFYRYLAVFKPDGFYFALGVFLARDLRPSLVAGRVFHFEELAPSICWRADLGTDSESGNCGVGAVPSDSFLGTVIENCVRAVKGSDWRGTDAARDSQLGSWAIFGPPDNRTSRCVADVSREPGASIWSHGVAAL